MKTDSRISADLKAIFGRLVAGLQRKPPAAMKYATSTNMSPPVVIWPNRSGTQMSLMACPNCGSHVAKPLLLTIEFTTSPGCRKTTTVLRCPDCTCPFYSAQTPPDYTEDAMLERGRVPFYLQQGAGVSLITRPLARLRAPPGSFYAEVGCGFGFGLDYAHHAKQWTGRGIDPGGIARLGQDLLGVSIDRRYLGESEPDLAGKCDVVMASETIEHVLSPIGFVRVLRSMLRPGGSLILTTPDGADLRPETAPGALIGLLSPGLHLIFQTAASLRQLLESAGFGHIVIERDGHALVGFASDLPIDLQSDETTLKTEFRSYLEHRAAAFPPEQDLFLAFAGRALQEAVNAADFDQARRLHVKIERACLTRFGRNLDVLGQRAAEHKGKSLQDLAQCMPLGLGGLLHADAIMRLAAGEPRAGLGKRFLWAAVAADLLRVALADLALADGMSEDIAWTARAEAVLCCAAAGANDFMTQLFALPAGPDAENGALRREVLVERCLTELVNAGHYKLANKLVDAADLETRPWADPNSAEPRPDTQRDALFCLAVLNSRSNELSSIESSQARFGRVRQMLEIPGGHGGPDGLYEAAVRGEAAASERLRHHAAALVQQTAVDR